jgi:phospholipid transport system substrate-binding protein
MKLYKSLLITGVILSISLAGEDPKELIARKDSELKKTIALYRKNPSQENKRCVIALINNIFDFSLIGKKTIPQLVWDKADSTTRNSFVTEFRRMVESSSVKKLEMYQSDSINYEVIESAADNATVSATMWYKGQQTRLHYKMINSNSQWKVWDLQIEDLSTVRSYRDQFKAILENKTLPELTEMLRKKADANRDP